METLLFFGQEHYSYPTLEFTRQQHLGACKRKTAQNLQENNRRIKFGRHIYHEIWLTCPFCGDSPKSLKKPGLKSEEGEVSHIGVRPPFETTIASSRVFEKPEPMVYFTAQHKIWSIKNRKSLTQTRVNHFWLICSGPTKTNELLF